MARDDLITAPAPSRGGLQLFEPLMRLRTEVDRLFDDIPFRFPAIQVGRTAAAAMPALEVKETEKAYKVTAELPGMDGDDVEVTFEDGILRIAGEKEEEKEENEGGYRLSERSYGAFERQIELPGAADEAKIKAAFKNGVLTVTVPKDAKAAKSARRIAVEKA